MARKVKPTAQPAADPVAEADGAGARAAERVHALLQRTRAEIASQAERWGLWIPVAFGGGGALYIGLRQEPSVWLLLGVFLIGAAVAWGLARLRFEPVTIAACLALAFAGGVMGAKVRQLRVDAPVVPALDGPVTVEGWVVDVDSPGARGARILVAPARISGLSPEETPHRVRVTVEDYIPAPGSPVRFRALLNPPPPPASPGAYDFARDAYFRGIGGVGVALTPPRATELAPAPWRLHAMMDVNAFRWRLAQRITDQLGARTGGIAAAMVTGHEAWISQEDTQVMRDSGLAHILSISGLHMVIVGGFVFFAVRLGVAAWPWLALRAPGKKIAAMAGLAAVWIYLLVSGAPPPAERAAMTATVAFVAILIDRRAITMNGLAVAAMFVLLMQPETVSQAGFQMSFAATAALVALAEVWPARIREISAPWPILAIQRGGAWVLAACMASLVAGLATGPFAMQHFNRTAVFGLFANLAVAPLSSFVIMPFLAVGAALELLGLGGPFLWVSGKGIDAMLWVGEFTAGLPSAVHLTPSAPQVALVISFLGILVMCLWRGRLRLLGLPMALAVLLWPRPEAPDLWIADDGTTAVVRQGRTAVVLRPGVKQFSVDLWTRRRGLTIEEEGGARAYACDRNACAPGLRAPMAVAGWWAPRLPPLERLNLLCENAELVILRPVIEALPPACRGKLVLDGADFRRGGALELWRRDGAWLGTWSSTLRGERPWSPPPNPAVRPPGAHR